MRRCSSIPSPLAAVALLLLLLCFFHCVAASSRLLLAAVPDPLVHHDQDGVKAVAVHGVPVVQSGGAVNGDDLSVSSEMMGEDEEPAPCEEGSDDDECMQRRLLHDAHLDYIYTQHKGNKQP